MQMVRAVGSGARRVGRGARATGRGIRAGSRGLRALYRWGRTVGGERRTAYLAGLAWGTAVVLFWVAFGTAPATYAAGGYALAPFIAALAALPFGFVATRQPGLGWGVSVASAALLADVLPLVPGRDWPWTVVHGLVMLALLFAVCARDRWLPAVGAWALTAFVFSFTAVDVRAGWIVAVSAVALFGLLAGTLTRTRRSLARQERLTSEEKARRLVLEERTRIARDLHDIVAHHMSLVVVAAETAPYRLPDLPETVRAELDSIGGTARAALAETRSLLSVLRSEQDGPQTAPQPGIELLDELVDGARRAGVPVETSVHGSLRDLRPGTSLAAYRILQEALANAARHAPGAPVRLDVSRDDATLTLSVLNGALTGGPTGTSDPDAAPSTVEGTAGPAGHGITGMRERVSAEGGEMTVGPTSTGGFAVRASLPLAG